MRLQKTDLREIQPGWLPMPMDSQILQMQAIARELNNAETAFILSPTAPDHDVWIRFFTPTTEVPSCGHATISAHYVRALEKKLLPCTIQQRIGIGILPVDIVKDDSGTRIIMTQGNIEISDPVDVKIQTRIQHIVPFK